MKKSIYLIIGLAASIMYAQGSPEVIYCNENQNVALVMESPIAQAVTGSENFTFTYNPAAVDSLGLLQGRPGEDSNLLIRTIDGGLYSYILKHRDSLSEFVHFIKTEARIPFKAQENNHSMQRNNFMFKKGSAQRFKNDYQKLSQYFLARPTFSVARKKRNLLKLEVQGVYYYGDEVGMVINISNNSQIDFKVNTLEFAKVQGTKKRKSSFQKIPLVVNYPKEFPEVLRKRSQRRFIVFLPKFTLGKHEKLQMVLSEEKGSRYIRLRFSDRDLGAYR